MGGENRSIYDDPIDAYAYAIFWSSHALYRGGTMVLRHTATLSNRLSPYVLKKRGSS